MENLLNVSSSPHARGHLSTRSIMCDVIIALLPTTVIGIWAHGVRALCVILVSIVTAVGCEYLFDRIAKWPNTAKDCSAIVTGLLLALSLPAQVPLYIPFLGAMFAIVVVKCCFGGLGKNIVNPALAGRCFLLISFGAMMTTYSVDGVTAATPLAQVAAGETVKMIPILVGTSSGVIGSSALGLLAGGIFLFLAKGITLEIPISMILSTAVFLALFGGHGLSASYLIPQLLGGGVLMAAFFMATDPVSCPSTSKGQIVFGIIGGILIGLFRVKGTAADSTTYAIMLTDLIGPMIDDFIIPLPFAYRIPKERRDAIPKPVMILLVVALIAGVALSGVYVGTKDRIESNKTAAYIESYKAVLPEADSFEVEKSMENAIPEGIYGTDFGKSTINSVATAKDASGNTVGYVVSVTSGDAFDGTLTLTVGVKTDGTVTGIAFTELNETPGMGMKCGEEEFTSQFVGANVSRFTLNKAGGSTTPDSIDSVSGASTTSGAVVNAVNAAIDFIGSAAK